MVSSLNYMKEYYNFHVSLIWCKCLLIFLYDALSTQRGVFGVVNLSIWVLITSAYIQIVSFNHFLFICRGTWYYTKKEDRYKYQFRYVNTVNYYYILFIMCDLPIPFPDCCSNNL